MLVRKNTKEHSALVQTLEKYVHHPERKKLIKPYIVEAGKQLKDRISVEKTGSFADVYYNLTLDSILKNVVDDDHQLHKTEDGKNLYYFESKFTPAETPFELDSSLLKEIEALIKDKKFKVRKNKAKESLTTNQEQTQEKEAIIKPIYPEKKNEKEGGEKKKDISTKLDYGLDQTIDFTNINRPLTNDNFRKKEVLEYYNFIFPNLLPFIENTPLFGQDIDEIIREKDEKRPDWIKTVNVYMDTIAGEFFITQSKAHLLWLAQIEAFEIDVWLSKNKNFNNPEFLILSLVPNESDFKKVVQAALETKEILDISELKGFIKTTGEEILHVHIPLDGKSNYSISLKFAHLLAQLMSRKNPGLITLDKNQKRKVFLNTELNALGKTVIAPYSIKKGKNLVATPLQWEELNEDLDFEKYTTEYVMKKAKKEIADQLLKDPVNANLAFEILDRRYRFLL